MTAWLDLQLAEPQDEGSVVRLKVAFPDGPRTYSYALIKLGDQWYLTGAENKKSRTWEDLIAWLKNKNAEVITIQRATEWETL